MLTKATLAPPATFDAYGDACDLGRECAANFVQSLRRDPTLVGTNQLGWVLDNTSYPSETFARGYRAGFFGFIEHYLYAGARFADPFADAEAVSSTYQRAIREDGDSAAE
jgi:hypothetical protein